MRTWLERRTADPYIAHPHRGSHKLNGRTITARGTIEGQIAYEENGGNGFGYDPVFYLPERGCTTAQLEPEEKNKISHRGQALRKMYEILKKENVI